MAWKEFGWLPEVFDASGSQRHPLQTVGFCKEQLNTAACCSALHVVFMNFISWVCGLHSTEGRRLLI